MSWILYDLGYRQLSISKKNTGLLSSSWPTPPCTEMAAPSRVGLVFVFVFVSDACASGFVGDVDFAITV